MVKTLCDVRTYEVQFEDGTICGDLSINDIIVSHVLLVVARGRIDPVSLVD